MFEYGCFFDVCMFIRVFGCRIDGLCYICLWFLIFCFLLVIVNLGGCFFLFEYFVWLFLLFLGLIVVDEFIIFLVSLMIFLLLVVFDEKGVFLLYFILFVVFVIGERIVFGVFFLFVIVILGKVMFWFENLEVKIFWNIIFLFFFILCLFWFYSL